MTHARQERRFARDDDVDEALVVVDLPEHGTPEEVLGCFVGRPVSIMFARDEVEAGELTYTRVMIEALNSEYGRAHFFRNVTVNFNGYDDDSRELFEIPEVRAFADMVVNRLPWAYFMDPQSPMLRLLAMCVTGGTFDRSTGQVHLDRRALYDVAVRFASGATSAVKQPPLRLESRDVLIADVERLLGFDEGVLADTVVDGEHPESHRPADVQGAVSVLARRREEWFQDRVTDIVDRLGSHGAELGRHVHSEAGRTDLALAVLAAKIAVWVGQSFSTAECVETAGGLALFREAPGLRSALWPVVETVTALCSRGRGLGIGEPWRPESGYLTLLELWALETRQRVGDAVLGHLMRRLWDETDEQALPYLLNLPIVPLRHCELLDEQLADAGDVATIIHDISGMGEVERTRRRELSALNLDEIPHLRILAGDFVNLRLIRAKGTQLAEEALQAGSHDFGEMLLEGVVQPLGEIFDELRDAVMGLSAYEVGRVAPNADRAFQDAILDTYINRYRLSLLREPLRGRHGTYGALPWWQVPVTEEVVDLVLESIEARGGALAIDDGRAGEAALALASPSREGYWVNDYDLDLFEDVCELMLIARSRRICIDFVGAQDGEQGRFGSVVVWLSEEHVEQLLTTTTQHARAMIGSDDGYQPYAAVHQAVRGYFEEATTSWSRPMPQLVARPDFSV
jgi:hypothetical protein